jgi:hypothetical protein
MLLLLLMPPLLPPPLPFGSLLELVSMESVAADHYRPKT